MTTPTPQKPKGPMDTPDNRGEVGPSVQSAKESLESKRDLLHASKKVHTSCISVALTLTNHINAGSKQPTTGRVRRRPSLPHRFLAQRLL